MSHELYKRYGKRKLAVDLSALEGRWAIFFDLLDVNWVFNPEVDGLERPLPFWLAFDYQGGRYDRGLPPERGLWVEVSETNPDKDTRRRLRDLARVSGHWVHLLVGEPQPRFGIWSWRFSQRLNIDALKEVGDFELYDAISPKTATFVVDFAFRTVSGHGLKIDHAFRVMREILEPQQQQ